MAQLLESTWATWRLGANRNASGRLEAPERRISSCVRTWIAEGVASSFSGRLATEVTSMSINSSKESFLNAPTASVSAPLTQDSTLKKIRAQGVAHLRAQPKVMK